MMELVKFLDSWGILGIAIGGGELFTHPNILEIVKQTWSQTCLDLSITTNGISVSEKQIDAIESYISEVRISIHKPESLGALEKLFNRKFDLGVNLLLFRHGTRRLSRAVEECIQLGVTDFLINAFKAVGRGSTLKHLEPTSTDYIELAKLIQEFSGKAVFKVSSRLAEILRGLGLYFKPFEHEARGRIIAITTDKKVKPTSLSQEAYSFTKPEEIPEIYIASFT
jgi:MoaA/NifB/PqqE/SkfB family radical SAM enzyme